MHGIEVEIRVSHGFGSKQEIEDAAAAGQPILTSMQKQILVKGRCSQREHKMLENAARVCPVGQYFSGEGLALETTVIAEGLNGSREETFSLPDRGEVAPTGFDESRLAGVVRCRHVRGFQSQVTMQLPAGGQGDGPWSFMVDERPPDGEGAGAPPTSIVMAAMSASTLSQLAGIDARAGIGLTGLQIDAAHTRPYGPGAETKTEREEAWAKGRRFTIPATKRLIVGGDVDEKAWELIRNVALYCPVTQMLMGAPIEEEFSIIP